MRITELLKQESIGLNVSVSTKEEAIDKLVDLMAAGGLSLIHILEMIYEKIRGRWRKMHDRITDNRYNDNRRTRQIKKNGGFPWN